MFSCLSFSKKLFPYFPHIRIFYTVSILSVLTLYVFKQDSEPVSERFFRRLIDIGLRSMSSAVLWKTPESRRLYLHKSRTKKTTTKTTTNSTASARMKIVNGMESSEKETKKNLIIFTINK